MEKNNLNNLIHQDIYMKIFDFLRVEDYYSLINTCNKEIIEVVEFKTKQIFLNLFFSNERNIIRSFSAKNVIQNINSVLNAISNDVVKLFNSFIFAISIYLIILVKGYNKYLDYLVDFQFKNIMKKSLKESKREIFLDICLIEYGFIDNNFFEDKFYLENSTLDFVIKKSLFNTKSPFNKNNPLLFSCEYNNFYCLKMSLSFGSDPFAFNKYGINSIFYCIKTDKIFFLETILNYVYIEDHIYKEFFNRPLFNNDHERYNHIMKYKNLIKKEDINNKNDLGVGFYYYVIKFKRLECFKIVFKHCQELLYSNEMNLFFIDSIKNNFIELSEFIYFNYKLDLLKHDHNGLNSLFYLVSVNNLNFFKLIIEDKNNSDLVEKLINSTTSYRKYLIQYICEIRAHDFLIYILGKKANVYVYDSKFKIPLLISIENNDFQQFNIIMKYYKIDDLLIITENGIRIFQKLLKTDCNFKNKFKEYILNYFHLIQKESIFFDEYFKILMRDFWKNTKNNNKFFMCLEKVLKYYSFFYNEKISSSKNQIINLYDKYKIEKKSQSTKNELTKKKSIKKIMISKNINKIRLANNIPEKTIYLNELIKTNNQKELYLKENHSPEVIFNDINDNFIEENGSILIKECLKEDLQFYESSFEDDIEDNTNDKIFECSFIEADTINN